MIILKRNAKGITMTRHATGESFDFFIVVNDRQEVENRLINVFQIECDNVIIVDENGTLIKTVEP